MAYQTTTTFIQTTPGGGSSNRVDTKARVRNLENDEIDGRTYKCPDLGTATTQTIWSRSASSVQVPKGLTVIVDPGDQNGDGDYEDNASSPPSVTIETTYCDASDGTSNP